MSGKAPRTPSRRSQEKSVPLPLIRFAALHFSLGLSVGVIVAAVLLFSGTGGLAHARAMPDRLLGFLFLATNLGGCLGIASLATGLHFTAQDG